MSKLMVSFNFTFMRSMVKKIFIVGAYIFCAVSCQKDIDEMISVVPNGKIITISAEINDTRTYIADESNGIVKWSENDQLKVIENATSYSSTSHISIDDNGKAKFTVAFEANTSATEFTYNAIYPASSVIEDAKINTEKVKVLVSDEQNPTETSFDSHADILVSKQIVTSSQPAELDMQFKRLVSIGKLTLKNLPVEDKVHRVIFIAGDEDILAGRNYVNATTGKVIRYGYNNSTNTITLNYSSPITTRDIYFTCNPFEMNEDEVFTVVAVCDGTTYTREVIIPNGKSLKFTEGNMSSFTVDMSKATQEKNELSSKFNIPIIQWNMTKNEITQEMSNYELLHSDDTTLIYSGIGAEDIIAYSFVDDQLDASIVYVPSDRISLSDINALFSEYEKIDQYNGFYNSEKSTFANISSDGAYHCIGWAECIKEKIGSAKNKIWYTNGSTTDATVPCKTDAFGVNIISNKYDVDNECWVITFDGDVKRIGERAFSSAEDMTTITLPSSVTKIGEYAFYGCSSLTSITIPDSVTSIGDYALGNCSSLTSVTIGNGVTSIGDYALGNCTSLTSVTIPDSVTSIGCNAFRECTNLIEFKGKCASDGGCSLIVGGELVAFAPGCGVVEYTIPNRVTTIGEGAFYRCGSLTSITIPDSVTEIGGYAFWNCNNLKNVYCKPVCPPNGGRNMFYNNASDRKIYVCVESLNVYKNANYWKDYANDFVTNGNITDDQTTIIYYTTNNGEIIEPLLPVKSNSYSNGIGELVVYGELRILPENAFKDCKSLTSITIPDSVTSIGDYALGKCSSLTSVTIPDSVTSIGDHAFYSCTSLKSVTIGNGVTSIGEWTFSYCTSLTSVTIPDSVTSIEYHAFSDCTSLKSVTIGNGVTSIGERAFSDCKALTSVTIGDSIQLIEQYAFWGCANLKSLYCKSPIPPELENINVFQRFKSNYDTVNIGCKIYVPTGSVTEYKTAIIWSEYASYIIGYDF